MTMRSTGRVDGNATATGAPAAATARVPTTGAAPPRYAPRSRRKETARNDSRKKPVHHGFSRRAIEAEMARVDGPIVFVTCPISQSFGADMLHCTIADLIEA